MSIQPGRVVFRIVDEIARGPGLCLAVERAAATSPSGDALVETARVAVCSPGRQPEFPTLFHFWTQALRAFLEESGQADQLAGVAGYAMCERRTPQALENELEKDCFGLADPAAVGPQGRLLDGYRMIEGPCRASLVVETDTEWWAVLRSHGPRVRLRCLT